MAEPDLLPRVLRFALGRAAVLARHRDRARQLEHTNRELSRFAAALAHDLRGPLATVQGLAELLSLGDLGDDDRTALADRLMKTVDRSSTLVADLLRDAEVGGIREEVDPAMVVRWVRSMLARDVERAGAALTFRGPPGLRVWAVTSVVRQVVLNLVANSLRYAGRDGEVRIEVVAVAEPDGTSSLTVHDDGPGVPVERREEIFEPGVGDPDVPGSTGMGLASVRSAVHRHGGRVEALDSPLGGLAVRTTWPAESEA